MASTTIVPALPRWAPPPEWAEDRLLAPGLEQDFERLRTSYDFLEKLCIGDAELIRQLRKALRQYAPDHPLLQVQPWDDDLVPGSEEADL